MVSFLASKNGAKQTQSNPDKNSPAFPLPGVAKEKDPRRCLRSFPAFQNSRLSVAHNALAAEWENQRAGIVSGKLKKPPRLTPERVPR